ncbi:hypothetical protein DPMN_158202 [Dreissena polymorpha]|uniref:Uncharacterized protein n=1 Tax=Dreissena polymorpha TaxID=45954 RepID=A0A9D4EJE1_DREPO|nr:hypothetical protein DPMN_158202 [Dreissena polymorpha]
MLLTKKGKHNTSMVTQKGKHATSVLTKKGSNDLHDTSMLRKKGKHDTFMLTKKGGNDLKGSNDLIHTWGISGFGMAIWRRGFISVFGLVAAEAATRTTISVRALIWDMGLRVCA